MDKYNEFIKKVELLDISVEKISCEKKISYQECTNELKINMEPEFKLHRVTEDQLITLAHFHLECYDEEQTVFEIHTTFQLLYNLNDAEIDDAILERFIEINVPVNIWPYGRELISSLTTRLGFPALIIGTYKTVR